MTDLLTKHFSLAEATVSAKAKAAGIINYPDTDADYAAILRTAIYMEQVRVILGGPIIVNSWYRNAEVNKLVGGVPNSQHQKGEAVDFVCPTFGSPYKICALLAACPERQLPFDQLILEPTWVHLSFCTAHPQGKPRREVLTLAPDRKTYYKGLLHV